MVPWVFAADEKWAGFNALMALRGVTVRGKVRGGRAAVRRAVERTERRDARCMARGGGVCVCVCMYMGGQGGGGGGRGG